jgi:hypothetical protein
MNAARQFYANNSGLVQNVLYILTVVVVVYLVYSYLTAGSSEERYVIQLDMSSGSATPYGLQGNASTATLPSGGVPRGDATTPLTEYCINMDNSAAVGDSGSSRGASPLLRIKEGSDFTFSWWMYISAWNSNRMGVIKPVICITDPEVSDPSSGGDSAYIMITFLYPNTNKLGIRFHTRPTAANEVTWMQNFLQCAKDPATAQQAFSNTGSSPVCDINDIDMQRWLNFTVVVSGRVVDVYYDGKLNRSCVLPGAVVGSSKGFQMAVTSLVGGFNGYLNGVFFAGRALTPDRIYGLYQAGPQGTTSIVRALFSRLGINMSYRGGSHWANFL